MVPESPTQSREDSADGQMPFVCPICGTTYPTSRRHCSRCGGNIVVPVENTSVYETVLPLCGPDCRSDSLRGEANATGTVTACGWDESGPIPGTSIDRRIIQLVT